MVLLIKYGYLLVSLLCVQLLTYLLRGIVLNLYAISHELLLRTLDFINYVMCQVTIDFFGIIILLIKNKGQVYKGYTNYNILNILNFLIICS